VELDAVEVTGNRIALPFPETSRTIIVIDSLAIRRSVANNLNDLLQHIPGIDIRRRGADGMQADLYIRGGNFDQTLVLIDGVKMDDPQTGHHTMNAVIPLKLIERVEIIKGPAARIYGQNAFSGAINIITRKIEGKGLELSGSLGTHTNVMGALRWHQEIGKTKMLASFQQQASDGYRYNTDFRNRTAFLKLERNAISMTGYFTERKFGANGFYASPDFLDQYEETQTSMISVSTRKDLSAVTLKPRLYWRRNQDIYLFLRQDPGFYRNMHISNKIGGELNLEIRTDLGKTGLGVDWARTELRSNNLGNHDRTSFTGFLEHRVSLFDGSLDLTPGAAFSHYSDFGTELFPGIDLGYDISDNLKIYGNLGRTYRIPTFTDLYYVGPTTQGNAALKPESALSHELGLKYRKDGFHMDIAWFHRKSDDLIDWTKDREADKWETRNFSKVVTRGFESAVGLRFDWAGMKQQFKLSYSYIDDQIRDEDVTYTRYSLNSLKHQFTTGMNLKPVRWLDLNFSYRYVERTDGTSYNLVDAGMTGTATKNLRYTLTAQNLFNELYTETNGVVMPRGTVILGVELDLY
jgi:iron complex outermembrane receptor protein